MVKAHQQRHVHRLVQIGHAELSERLQPRIGLAVRLDHVRQIDDLFQLRHVRVPGRVPADCAEHLRVVHVVDVLRDVRPGDRMHQRLGFLHHRVELFVFRRLRHLAERHALGAVMQQPGQRGLFLVHTEFFGHLARRLLHAERVRIARRVQLLFQPVRHFFAFHPFNSMPDFAP